MNLWFPSNETFSVLLWQDLCGKDSSNKYFSKQIGKHVATWEYLFKCATLLVWTTAKWLERNNSVGTNVETSAKRNPSGRAETKCVSVCTHRESEVDHHAVQAKADLFRRTTTEVTDEKQNKNPLNQLPRRVATWNKMPKHVGRYCEVTGECVSELKPARIFQLCRAIGTDVFSDLV